MSISILRGVRILLLLLPVVLTGCARTSTAPVGADTIEVTVHVGTICDGGDAERLARRHAAVETIRRGFDDYVVIDSVGGDHTAKEEPATARTTLSGGSGRTLFSEDAPLLAHHRVLTVRMFQAGEGDSAATVSARAVLGDEWEAVVARGPATTCLGVGG